MKKLYVLLFFFSVVVGADAVAQTIRYVKAGGTGNGSSWAAASGDLQATIDASTDADSVWVAAGTYKPAKAPWPKTTTGVAVTQRDNAFVLKRGVRIFGGFVGNESVFEQRNFETNVTILSGDLNNDGIASTGDAYHVVISLNNSDDAILDGFTIQHGYADGTLSIGTDNETSTVSLAQNVGGGICTRGTTTNALYSNLIIRDNYALTTGGGVYQRSGGAMKEFRFENVKFINNLSVTSGGAVYLYPSTNSPQVFFDKCYFENNKGSNGGAIGVSGSAITGSTLNIKNSEFRGSIATSYGGHVYVANRTANVTNSKFYNGTAVLGGALYTASNASALFFIYDSYFEGNKSTSTTSTVAASGGGAIVLTAQNENAKGLIQGSKFVSNQSANVGGAIHLASNSTPIISCSFIKNTAAFSGGAISMYSASNIANSAPDIINSMFYANESKGTAAANAGGAIFVPVNGCPNIVNVTFYANKSATVGGALYLANNDAAITASGSVVVQTRIYNSILYGNIATTYPDIRSVGVNSMNLRNTMTQVYGIDGDNDNIVGENPIFASVDEVSPEFLRLGAGSRAVNMGDSDLLSSTITTDLGGKNRVIYDFLDLGAYEYDGSLESFHAFYINENSPIGTLVGTLTTDLTGSLTWSIVTGNTGESFELNPTTGVITVKNDALLDYETRKAFRLRVRAVNGASNDTFMAFVILENVMEDPGTPILTNLDRGEVRSYFPRLAGNAEPLSTVYIYMDNNLTPYTTETDSKGNWSIKFGEQITPGVHAFYIVTENSLGRSNPSDEVSANFILYPGTLVANNILTPNGDGKNDVWVVQHLSTMYPKNEVIVYDKTGKVVFKKANYQNDWDGSYNGASLNTGTYYYQITIGNDIKPVKGTLTILRGR